MGYHSHEAAVEARAQLEAVGIEQRRIFRLRRDLERAVEEMIDLLDVLDAADEDREDDAELSLGAPECVVPVVALARPFGLRIATALGGRQQRS